MEYLFRKYLQGECDRQEISLLMSHFKQPENELLLKQLIISVLEDANNPQVAPPDLDSRLNAIYAGIKVGINQEKQSTGFARHWRRYAAAAAITVFFAGTLYYLKHTSQPTVELVAGNVNVKPGSTTATLTLADGTRIVLKDHAKGNIATQTGAGIIKTDNGELIYRATDENDAAGELSINQLSTASGQQYTVVLPDGSRVTLNAASSIKYPVSFNHLNERRVELMGEACFVVQHNPHQPFRVVTRNQVVEDVGTTFNISSYADEQIEQTTLVSGAASVTPENGHTIQLLPNDQARLSNNQLKVLRVNPDIVLAWKNGQFAYQDTPLEDVMRQVARWYNVQVIYQNAGLKAKRLSGSVSKYEQVAGILNAIGYTANVRFRLEGRTITVLPAN